MILVKNLHVLTSGINALFPCRVAPMAYRICVFSATIRL